MAFRIDAKGIPESGGYSPVPPGKYILQIISAIEGFAKNSGKPQVVVGFKIAEGEHQNKKILFHRVTFLGKDENGMPMPGAGIAIHFLHSIGEPYEDANTTVEAQRWIGKTLMGTIEVKPDFNGNLRNNVKFVDPLPLPLLPQAEHLPVGHSEDTEEIPF